MRCTPATRQFSTALFLCAFVSTAYAQTTFAEVDPNTGAVLRVIVADQRFINTGRAGDPARWVQTHQDGSQRKIYAGPGYTYDPVNDEFVPPKPFPSWRLTRATQQWDAPVSRPATGEPVRWNEPAQRWDPYTRP